MKKVSRADRDLGMNRAIPRRDFLQGVLCGASLTLTGALRHVYAADAVLPAGQDAPGYYPPLLTGLRGSHPGSFETAHGLRDGNSVPSPQDLDERYDLIVVGGGISGLSAAHFYRAKHGAKSRILILDNHDDFGGHAKRNEFQLHGRTHLLNGGTLLINSPRPYGAQAAGLVRTLGIDIDALQKTQNHDFYGKRGMSEAIFFDKETFGADRLVVRSQGAIKSIAQYPLSDKARADITRIETQTEDFMLGLSSAEKKDRLSRMSYRDFLLSVVKADPDAVKIYQQATHGEWAVGADAVSALDVWGLGFPGFKGMHLAPGSTPRMGFTAAGYKDTGGSKSLHFPDGNATLARLLVRDLVPSAVPGHSAEDVVMARVDYAQLDRPGSPVRVRLSSTVLRAFNVTDSVSGAGTEITYARGGKTFRLRSRHCVLAGYNMMIPYLCPGLPDAQKAALHELVKAPLVYTSVAVRNWQAFDKLKVSRVHAPGGYFCDFSLNQKVDVGDYRSVDDPNDPILLHLTRTPCKPGLPEHDQNRAGRADLLATSFETFERNIRDQLGRTLSDGGFDPAEDIEAITVNRWPHGYAAEYNHLWLPEVPPEQQPQVAARRPFGRITIANSDSGGGAYTDVAIEQAHRAVNELPS